MAAAACAAVTPYGMNRVWKDIDLKAARPTVPVNGTIVYMPGQGLTIQDHPKSAHSRQRFFLPAFAVEMLLRRQIGQLAANPWDVVFPSAVGSLRDPNNFRRVSGGCLP